MNEHPGSLVSSPMSAHTFAANLLGERCIARAMKERRKFRRVRVAVAGRLYVPATQEEGICTIEDISPGDASLLCELKQAP